MHELYELKEMLCKELEELGSKGELTAGSLDTADKLTHTLKNLDKIIEKKEEEGYSGRYDGRMYSRGNSYRDGGNGGNSYARGRGSNARRDSMGRYSSEYRDGYSRAAGDMAEEIRRFAMDAPNDSVRAEIEKMAKKMETM